MLLLGVSYKADVGDVRESPALRLIELLHELGADLAYHDPHVPAVERTAWVEELTDELRESADIVCIVTAHCGRRLRHVAESSRSW